MAPDKPTEERRRYPRKHIGYFTRVFDADSNESLGNLGDLSRTGAMVIGTSPLPVAIDYHLKIELSEDVAEKSFMFLRATSVWSKPDIDPRRYNTGFMFDTPSEEDRQIIERIIETYALRGS